MGSVPKAVSCPCVVVVILVPSQAAACDTYQDTKLRKVRFQLQRKLRQSTSKGNEFSARVSVSEISCPDFLKTLRKSLPMHCNVPCFWKQQKIGLLQDSNPRRLRGTGSHCTENRVNPKGSI